MVESFFKNDEGHNVTVKGDRYRAMITNFVIPELNNHDVQELWFQQDGATCHTARATIDLLKDTFGDHLISRFGPVNWPPRSCDLTPLDYFLWSYVKSLVYADKQQTLDHLGDNIHRVIADIRLQMLEKVIENWTSRLDYIRASQENEFVEYDDAEILNLLDFLKKIPGCAEGDKNDVEQWFQNDTEQDIMPETEITAAFTIIEKMPENNEDVNTEDTKQAPKETGSMSRSSAPYLETTILLVLLAWLVGGGVASLRQGSMGWLVSAIMIEHR
ncbi:putative DD41D transposase [Trichonephila clavipes]|nr:putative DD41D transposase [Trichonephila clavipes]